MPDEITFFEQPKTWDVIFYFNNKEIGRLERNHETGLWTFIGEVEPSTKVFFDYLIEQLDLTVSSEV